jgi:PPK2 family polyphosphate:nucleotide phosphotransferase
MPKGNLAPAATTISELLRAPSGRIQLSAIDPRATPGFKGKKADGQAALAGHQARLEELQEQLFAQGRAGGKRSLLLVLQGLDTSGKGGTVGHVVGAMNPGGVHAASFGPPTKEELSHDFLWRIRAQLPRAGKVGVFDRSHYEDVVTVGVLGLADKATIGRRLTTIKRFEERLADGGMEIVKCYLHISPEEQRARLLARLDDPTKQWKYNPGDLATRERWMDHVEAYERAMARSSTEAAPWHIIPADRKWYRNWAVSAILIERLEAMGLDWPKPDYDVEAERTKLLAMP